jgi:hypothetical protein
MSYTAQTLTRTASEASSDVYETVTAQMVQDFIDALTAADSRITELSGDETGVSINGKFKLILAAGSISGANTIVITIRNGSTDLASCYVSVRSGSSSATQKNFKLDVHMFISDNAFSLVLRNNNTSGANFNVNICAFTDTNSNTYVGYTATTNYNAATTRNFAADTLLFDLSDNSQGKTMLKRLPYVHDGSSVNIAKIDGKVILSGSQKSADIDGAFDCSTITGDMQYPSGSKTYYAVDDNTLVEI